ncbi:MAG: hydrogenase nickel incorporation protein HypB [Actinomycetota bacterium]|nr:hydrogenase nickel incorporation protein HypB [Actinomycetota bacterium]
MCTTCGCGQDDVRISNVGTAAGSTHTHVDAHGHVSTHTHGEQEHASTQVRVEDHNHAAKHTRAPRPDTQTVFFEQQILAKNDNLATGNRDWLAQRGIVALNLMSSPGAGKTSLLERTIRETRQSRQICVIEGDQETLLDAERIRDAGARAVQINTGAGCHLDAAMVRDALEQLEPPTGSLLMVENVGNLVCPALFDIGETGKVVVISVTEGDDKPLKYPHMFAAADLVVINKIDLLPYVAFNVDACAASARSVNPDLKILTLSVTTGAGLDGWYEWLRRL